MIDQGPLVICCMEGTILPSQVGITVYISKAMKSGSGDEPISTSWNVRVLLTLLTCRFHICCWWPDDFTRFQRMPRLANLLQSDATQKLSPRQKRCYRAADRNMMSLGLLELGCRLQNDSWYNRSNRWNTLNLLTWGSVRKIYLRSMSLRKDFQFASFFLINVTRCRSHLFQSELTSVSDINSYTSPGWHHDTSAGNSLRPFPCFTKGMCQVTKVKLNSLSSQFWQIFP